MSCCGDGLHGTSHSVPTVLARRGVTGAMWSRFSKAQKAAAIHRAFDMDAADVRAGRSLGADISDVIRASDFDLPEMQHEVKVNVGVPTAIGIVLLTAWVLS